MGVKLGVMDTHIVNAGPAATPNWLAALGGSSKKPPRATAVGGSGTGFFPSGPAAKFTFFLDMDVLPVEKETIHKGLTYHNFDIIRTA